MRRDNLRAALLWLPLAASLAAAAEVVYVTDLQLFTELAPCAQEALSYNIMSQTDESCPEAVTGLQSCICKSQMYTALAASISTSVSSSCGPTATADQASASTVLSAYCSQDDLPVFPTPSIKVAQFISDIPEITYLAPCASSQLVNAVASMTYELCPADAANLATCVCQKNQNSLLVSQMINTWVSMECSSHTVDISSAQAFYAAYCNLNSGTSDFPTASDPPGDMTYYITDMPQFSSMAGCMQSAVSSAVFTNTYDLCPEGPQLLASCVCIKESMSPLVSSYITYAVKSGYCSSYDAESITSALAVFGEYCSAAENKLAVTGISNSVSQTAPTGLTRTAHTATAATTKSTARAGSATQTGTATSGSSTGSSGSESEDGEDGDSSSDSGSKSNTGVIVGAVVGVVGGLAIVALATFFVCRRVRKNKSRMASNQNFQQLDNLPPSGGFAAGHKAELGGTELGAAAVAAGAGAGYKPPPSPNPSQYNNNQYNSNNYGPYGHGGVSPVVGHPGGHNMSPAPPELSGQSAFPPPHSELSGQSAYPQAAELQSGSPPPAYGRAPSPYAPGSAVSPQSPSGMTYQSGPVQQSYSELDGNYQRGGYAR